MSKEFLKNIIGATAQKHEPVIEQIVEKEKQEKLKAKQEKDARDKERFEKITRIILEIFARNAENKEGLTEKDVNHLSLEQLDQDPLDGRFFDGADVLQKQLKLILDTLVEKGFLGYNKKVDRYVYAKRP